TGGPSMTRSLRAVCRALALGALAPPLAWADQSVIEGLGHLEVGDAGGDVRLVKGGATGRDWELRLWDGATAIRLASGDRAGWYLAYDPAGKDPGVFLTRRRGPGTEWKLAKARGGPAAYTIRAAAGGYEGWYLDAGGEAERLGDVNGKPYRA